MRRVLQGESVPAPEKLLSLFAPPTQILQRHNPGKGVGCGRKLGPDEVEGGIVSRYTLVPGAGTDHAQVAGSLAGHQARFGRAPWLVAGDRGVASAANEALAQTEGGKRGVLPQKGTLSAQRRGYERQRWFRRGFRFRAGIEGRSSVLRCRFGLGRCLAHGEAGMGRWVGGALEWQTWRRSPRRK